MRASRRVRGLPTASDAAAIVERAEACQVGVVSLDRYRLAADLEPALVIGYGNFRDGRERDAIQRLARAIGS